MDAREVNKQDGFVKRHVTITIESQEELDSIKKMEQQLCTGDIDDMYSSEDRSCVVQLVELVGESLGND